MFRALVWKEWRQLRALRWSGVALGVLLPFAFLAGAKAAERGMLFGRVGENAARTILVEILPAAYTLAVWPLLSMLFVSQAFAGERSAGIETFLLERAVPRSRAWLARLAASFGSALALAGLTAGVAVLLALTQTPTRQEWDLSLGMAAAGGILAALAALGTLAAAAVAPSPMTAVLLGLLLGAAPIGLASALAEKFPRAAYDGMQLGVVVCGIVPLGMIGASWVAGCLGEPAGRGRLRRFAAVLGGALILSPGAFFALAPSVLRLEARALRRGAHVIAAQAGGLAVVRDVGMSWDAAGAWLIEPETGRIRRFLASGVEWATHGPSGRLALATGGSRFGTFEPADRIRILEASGRPLGRPVPAPGFPAYPTFAAWVGSTLVVLMQEPGNRIEVALVDVETGALRKTGVAWSIWRGALIGPTPDDRVFCAIGPDDTHASDEIDRPNSAASDLVPYDVVELDVRTGRLAEKPRIRDSGRLWSAPRRLSPSGRYWLVDHNAGKCDARPVFDLERGVESGPRTPSRMRVWLAGDVLAWLETSGDTTWLLAAQPGEDPKPLRGWKGFSVRLDPSPDRKLLLVDAQRTNGPVWPRCESFPTAELSKLDPGDTAPGAAVYDPASSRWIDLPALPTVAGGVGFSLSGRSWAGPRTLARTGPGYLGLEDLDRAGVVRDVIGRAP